MARLIYKSFFLFLVFSFSSAKAGVIENCDAFQPNDKLALRELDTGLVWLDFGVNNGESINSVVSNLNSLYSGWRLPSEKEVINLWEKLSQEDLTDIFDVWGANKTPKDNLPYLSWGYFVDDEGYLGAAYIMEVFEASRKTSAVSLHQSGQIAIGIDKKIIDVKYDGSDFYLFNLDGAAEISTLLVKKSEVSEPSLLVVSLLGFFGLISRRLLY